MKAWYILFGLATTGLLVGCGAPPSQTDAETYWRNLLANSSGLIRLVSFAKTDGKSNQDHYTLYYSVTYEFTDDCQYDSSFHAQRGLPQGMDFFGAMGTGKTLGRKDHRISQTGQMIYEKRERGWQLVAMENGRVSDSTSKAVLEAEENQQRKIAEKKEAEVQRMLQLTAKSKERTRTVKTLSTIGNSGQRTDKVILTDIDITYIEPDGPPVFASGYTIWFGDIRNIQEFEPGQWVEVHHRLAHSSVRPRFSNNEEMHEFGRLVQSTFDKWRRTFPGVWEFMQQNR